MTTSPHSIRLEHCVEGYRCKATKTQEWFWRDRPVVSASSVENQAMGMSTCTYIVTRTSLCISEFQVQSLVEEGIKHLAAISGVLFSFYCLQRYNTRNRNGIYCVLFGIGQQDMVWNMGRLSSVWNVVLRRGFGLQVLGAISLALLLGSWLGFSFSSYRLICKC